MEYSSIPYLDKKSIRHVSANSSFTWHGNTDYYSGATDSKNILQVGVVAQTKLAKQLTGWASVGAGNKLISADIGIGYAATKNLDVNLSYDYSKYNSITSYAGQDYDITTKGLHLGLTFNF